ncbi:MAG: protein kinase [Acidobacteria bacterium]|nr:protein kinase [Acidobacteriota bacterium]
MRGPDVLGLDNAPRYAYAVAGVLLLTVTYSVVQIGLVRPDLPVQARTPTGMILQLVVFTGAAIVLFLLRSSDATAALSVLALALSGLANSGPARGVDWNVPFGAFVTGISWAAGPVAFPIIALAILYFPSKSGLLDRYPVLHTVPWIAAAPMLVLGFGKTLHLWGVDALGWLTAWDRDHPGLYYTSFSVALAINIVVIAEGVYRYRFNHDANERRRIRMAVYTAVPGVLAYAIKDGAPIAAQLLSSNLPPLSRSFNGLLHALILLPAFGLVYAVGVQRVLGPRVVLRRSLQYAFATRSMTVLALLPAIPVVLMLVGDRAMTLGDIAANKGIVYLGLFGVTAVAFMYRERARVWLDQRFFREEYDARKILMSLASRVRFETDPADLAVLIVKQLDEALHPEMAGFIVEGVEPGRLSPVATLRRDVEPLASEGALVSMLRWSEEPLEIFLDDPRSSVKRLPLEEQEWLERSGASLLVPVLGDQKALVGVILLGEKRSEEAYTDEDRQLLASIASQVGLGFDVARLRRRVDSAKANSAVTRAIGAAVKPMAECPKCGRCEEGGTVHCPNDGAVMQLVPAVPRIIDNKYRVEQLLGRGGMGAVYRARDVRLDRLVALKVVRADLLGDTEARQRFRREAQIVAGLQHPSIVSVFDYGTFPDGGAFLVMELVRGEDLRRVLLREGWLEPERALRILMAVCGAIEAAHREGVLHRDLKPENILLPGGAIDAKVLDFGVAKVVRDDRTEHETVAADAPTLVTAAGMIVGTPAYMAPEQLHGVAPDARCDIFSLGVVAFEMLTGELPFGRGSLAEIVLAHARGVPVFPPLRPLPRGIEHAIRAALDTDPDKRPPTVQAFGQLLTS